MSSSGELGAGRCPGTISVAVRARLLTSSDLRLVRAAISPVAAVDVLGVYGIYWALLSCLHIERYMPHLGL